MSFWRWLFPPPSHPHRRAKHLRVTFVISTRKHTMFNPKVGESRYFTTRAEDDLGVVYPLPAPLEVTASDPSLVEIGINADGISGHVTGLAAGSGTLTFVSGKLPPVLFDFSVEALPPPPQPTKLIVVETDVDGNPL